MKNVISIVLIHQKNQTGLSKFSLLVDESGAPKQFESQDETISALLPQINQKIETDKKEKKGNFSIFDSLKIFTEIYLEGLNLFKKMIHSHLTIQYNKKKS